MTILEMCLRVLLAMAIGGIIGWERETSNRPAGLRTHMLVAIGSAVIMLMGELSLYRYSGITTMDPTRLGAQVISGVGFLGAGTIMREGLTVRGLTTAASIWSVACLGLAAGGGFYEPAIGGTIAIIITLTIFEYLEKRFRKVKLTGIHVELECTELSDTLNELKTLLPQYEMRMTDVEIAEEEIEEEEICYHLTLKLAFNKSRKKTKSEGFLAELSALQGVTKASAEEY